MQDSFSNDPPAQPSRIDVSLASGRLVRVERFGFSWTYEGLLEGLPNARLNQQIIKRALSAASRDRKDGACLLTPAMAEEDGGLYLPEVCCHAELSSSALDASKDGSRLLVVWFAPPFFAEPLATFIQRSLRDLDWEEHAADFEY